MQTCAWALYSKSGCKLMLKTCLENDEGDNNNKCKQNYQQERKKEWREERKKGSINKQPNEIKQNTRENEVRTVE